MFTGLVVEVGRLAAAPRSSGKGGVLLAIEHGDQVARRLLLGSSLAVAGVCLTAVRLEGSRTEVELSPETLRRTRLGGLSAGARVNLEPALRAGDELGGHWVQGHVDGTLRLLERIDREAHRELTFELPSADAARVVEKGSIAIDGVSLTIADCADDRFSVALIPHTLEATTLRDLEVGERVHVEYDVLGKYVERWLRLRSPR